MGQDRELDELLCVGVISGVHGIKGEVKVKAFTRMAEDISAYGQLLDKTGKPLFQIKNYRITPKAIIVRLSGVQTRNDAERLRGTELYIKRDALPQAGEDEFYYSDLSGLAVRLKDGTLYGTVKSVQNFGAGDLIEIDPEPALHGKQGQDRKRLESIFFRFTEEIFPLINIAERTVTLVPPEMVEDSQQDQSAFLEQQEGPDSQ